MLLESDLLEQSFHLARRDPRKPTQASLRRSISTAYYALFHFLIEESKSNWRGEEAIEPRLRTWTQEGRFKPGDEPAVSGHDPQSVAKLKFLARTFVRLQERRHDADYNTESSWTRTQALEIARSVEKAFHEWEAIRKDPIVEEYLVALLIKQRN